jgi:hypothetical protein
MADAMLALAFTEPPLHPCPADDYATWRSELNAERAAVRCQL